MMLNENVLNIGSVDRTINSVPGDAIGNIADEGINIAVKEGVNVTVDEGVDVAVDEAIENIVNSTKAKYLIKIDNDCGLKTYVEKRLRLFLKSGDYDVGMLFDNDDWVSNAHDLMDETLGIFQRKMTGVNHYYDSSNDKFFVRFMDLLFEHADVLHDRTLNDIIGDIIDYISEYE